MLDLGFNLLKDITLAAMDSLQQRYYRYIHPDEDDIARGDLYPCWPGDLDTTSIYLPQKYFKGPSRADDPHDEPVSYDDVPSAFTRDLSPDFVIETFEEAIVSPPRSLLTHYESTRPALSTLTFEQQLSACGVKESDIPEAFYDPITMVVMQNPVIAQTCINNRGHRQVTTHCYDQTTFDKLGGICPENRQPFTDVRPNDALKAKMQRFIQQKQRPLATRDIDHVVAASLQKEEAAVRWDTEVAMGLRFRF